MLSDDQRRPTVLESIGCIRRRFATGGLDLGMYTDEQVVDALLATCPAVLGPDVWLNENHLRRTVRLLRGS